MEICDRFRARARGRRRPEAAAGVVRRVAQLHISLSILSESIGGGGETPRPPHAPASFNCNKSERNYLYAGILVLFAVELHTCLKQKDLEDYVALSLVV